MADPAIDDSRSRACEGVADWPNLYRFGYEWSSGGIGDPVRQARALPHLAGPADDVFVGGQLLQAHRAAGVELVRADADLRAETELVAVVAPGRGVPEHDGAVHPGEKFLRRGGV